MEAEIRTWWIVRGKEKFGPYTRTELMQHGASGEIRASDRIWKDGLKNPMAATAIKGLLRAAPTATDTPAGASPYAAPRADAAPEPADEIELQFSTEANRVRASRGIRWYGTGLRLFFAAPHIWIACLIPLVVYGLFLSQLPVTLALILNLLLSTPIMVGLLGVAYAIDCKQSQRIIYLFGGFRHRFLPLLGSAAINTVLIFTAMVVTVMLLGMLGVGNALLSSGLDAKAALMMKANSMKPSFGFLLITSASMLPLALVTAATFYAPALVYFCGASPLEALGKSLGACLRNWLPLTVHIVAGLLLLFLVSTILIVSQALLMGLAARVPWSLLLIPLFALPLIMIVPMMMSMIYGSFRDIFREDGVA